MQLDALLPDRLTFSLPANLLLSGASSDFQLIEAEGTDANAPKVKRFSIVGYTGGMMRLEGMMHPVVIDLEGMAIPRQKIPALYSHGRSEIVGHTTKIDKTQKRLYLEGVLSGHSDTEQTPSAAAAREVVRLAGNGFDWQASVGATREDFRFVPSDETVKANGLNFTGPLYLVTKSTLAEISFVAIGADMNTSASVAAAAAKTQTFIGGLTVDFTQWLAAKGINQEAFASLPEAVQATLKASHAAEHGASPSFDQRMLAIEAENDRIAYIRDRTAVAAEQQIGNTHHIKQLRELCASAIADKTVNKQAFDLALLRAERNIAPLGVASNSPNNVESDAMLEAAICVSQRLPGVEAQFDERTLEAAHKRFRRGLGLKELLVIAAERNNRYRGSSRDEPALCRAAFHAPEHGFLQASGPSTISVPGILSNVANKFIAAMFLYCEQSYRKIARIKVANDFKQMKTYRLTGSNKFEKIPPGGEIKHGTLGELTYTNQVETYGKLLGIGRQDIRNDDMNALTGAASDLARGAGDSLNEVFWTEWLDDAAFFSSGNANLITDTALAVFNAAGLQEADRVFRSQTKPDGTPLGSIPRILLVAHGLRATALTLMNSTITVGGSSNVPNANIWSGMFEVVDSVYISQTALGGLATNWYLLSAPQDIAAIELAFLDGIETPTIETSEFDFDRMGLAMRAWMDFGCSKMEYRAAVKSNGEAS